MQILFKPFSLDTPSLLASSDAFEHILLVNSPLTMGSCFSGDKSDQSEDDMQRTTPNSYVPISRKKRHTDQKQTLSAMSSFNSSKGVGLGISMMMYQAGMLAGCTSPSSMGDLGTLRDQIRKAKAEGRTVTVMNGCVYIDYQLKAQIPPGFNIES